MQGLEVASQIGAHMPGIKIASFIGGLPLIEDKMKAINCQMAIGTPGRVKQLLTEVIFVFIIHLSNLYKMYTLLIRSLMSLFVKRSTQNRCTISKYNDL